MKLMVLLSILLLPAYGQSGSGPSSSRSYGITTTSPAGSIENYRPANGSGRMRWFLNSTIGPSRLFLVGPINAGWGTMRDAPSECGTHWDGFGKRNGMRLTGVATGNLIEAELGSAGGRTRATSVRPHTASGRAFKYVVKTTFLAPHRDGQWHSAYARFAGNVGNNFLSNTWRAGSEAHTGNAVVLCVWGVLGRMTSDAFEEFWPDLRRKVLHKR